MFARHVVVDGSNIATEGRSMPSLVQLDEAVREYRREFPDDTIVVVVDATFGHRIDESERATFDEAVAHNEIVSPPAGAIGRGDAFLLRIAEKVGATVLSNDSFQEFHGEYDWLFTNGRLIGGKPVPGVGWIFTPRTPVRGPRSRDAVRTAKRERGGRRARPEEQQEKVQKAIAVATEEVVEPDSPAAKRRRRRRGSPAPSHPVNEPLAFIELVAKYPLGSKIEGEVDTFSSHGAFVNAGGVRCYIPLSALGEPPPRAAKDVLRKGETRTFVVQALDPPRRGVELALPEFAHISGFPSPETVEEEIHAGKSAPPKEEGRARGRGRGGRHDAVAPAEPTVAVPDSQAAPARDPNLMPEPAAAAGADESAPARVAARRRASAKTAPEIASA
ncbi:MAG TPA: S1 RNA-binding domain-containing protein [Acidimicrobiales bacterium]|nr:S1 RNA-binding domain-containing protein [Acidimicrobiales bacterium]